MLRRVFPIALAVLVPVLTGAWTLTAVFAASPSPQASASPGAASAPVGDPAKGATVFEQAGCISCHGANLEGGVGARLNPIESLPGINSHDPAALESVIKNGHPGQAQYASSQMPAFGSKLSSSDIADVVAYILQANAQGQTGLSPVDLARSTVFWVTTGIAILVLVTWLLARYNMRWIARRAASGRHR